MLGAGTSGAFNSWLLLPLKTHVALNQSRRVSYFLITRLGEAKSVAVRIVDVHLAVAPGLIGRFESDINAPRPELAMPGIHVMAEHHRPAPGLTITGE